MADLAAFLRMDGSFKRITIDGGTNVGRLTKSTNPIQNIEKRRDDTNYSAEYVQKQQNKLFKSFQSARKSTESETGEEFHIDEDEPDPVYTKYKFDNFIQSNAKELPIIAQREVLLDAIEANPVIVVQGDTGCGKSTQLPQMILDDCQKRNKRCNIIVTQPRRLAARCIAERVCNERMWPIGSLVGYQIALESRFTSEDTRICFCTTGLLLEKLIKTKNMANYTHIILDEVHERDKNMDFLFIIIRMLLCTDSPNVKLILMSATIETSKFAEYFKLPIDNTLVAAPVIQIKEKSQYEVKNFYLDDFGKLDKDLTIDHGQPGICDEMYKIAMRLVVLTKRLDENDPEQLTFLPAVLIFMPGINEINTFYEMLTEYSKSRPNLKWKILVVHSLMGIDQQHTIHRKVDDDVRKIILSTNIAESSLTVPNVRYVIDFCLTKTIQTDSATNFTSLCMGWASRSNLRQRSGRAGRVMNGRCYRLITKQLFENCLSESAMPELLRSPLETVVLKAKMLEMGPPHEILAHAMDIPKLSNVANTILVLKELGAMLQSVDGNSNVHDGDMTFVGVVMANLPIDVRLSRLIIFGYIFSVLEETIIMAAGLNVKSIFTQSIHDDLGAYSRKLEWSNGTGSDLFAIYNAYKVWTFKHQQNEFGQTAAERREAEKAFGKKHCIEIRSLNDCHMLVEELKKRLAKLGIEAAAGVNRVVWSEHQKTIVLKLIIGGAFYPNLFLRSSPECQKYDNEVFKMLNGRDPYATVYYQGFPEQYVREMYSSSIKQFFGAFVDKADMHNVKVSFGSRSERVFVTFNQHYNGDEGEHWNTHRSKIPGKIAIEVYKSIKMRKLRLPQKIRVMRPQEAVKAAERMGLGFDDHGHFVKKQNVTIGPRNSCMPRVKEKTLEGRISHFENCERFWFQPKRESEQLRRIRNELTSNSNRVLAEITETGGVEVSDVIAARDQRSGNFMRARILAVESDANTDSTSYHIFFIDYGHTRTCKLTDIRQLMNPDLQNLATQCFECRLAEIQPNLMQSETNDWSQMANEKFRSMIDDADQEVVAEIYSVVNGVAHVFITANGTNINDLLVEEQLAECCEENYMSKANHWRRQSKQNAVNTGSALDEVDYVDESEDKIATVADVETPPTRNCNVELRLRGPFSPLESVLYATMRSGSSKTIVVDPTSINSIILDNDLHDSSCKYVVAAAITSNQSSQGKLTLRETTLLPNIRGIGPLIALLFCPKMELKRDETKTRYISFISGLGYNKKEKQSIFEEHDSIFHLDVELTEDDFAMVNQIRYCFDTLLYRLGDRAQTERISADNKLVIMNKVKDLTLKLLTKKRNAMEIHTDYHTWNAYDREDIIHPEQVYEKRSIFPPHSLLRLHKADERTNEKLRSHCAELHEIARGYTGRSAVSKCQLCAMDFENIEQLRVHLISRLHLEREEQIDFNVKRNDRQK